MRFHGRTTRTTARASSSNTLTESVAGGRRSFAMPRPLHLAAMRGIHLSAICSRNRYERHAAPVIAELLQVAGDRTDVLAFEAGRHAGSYDADTLVAGIVSQLPPDQRIAVPAYSQRRPGVQP